MATHWLASYQRQLSTQSTQRTAKARKETAREGKGRRQNNSAFLRDLCALRVKGVFFRWFARQKICEIVARPATLKSMKAGYTRISGVKLGIEFSGISSDG